MKKDFVFCSNLGLRPNNCGFGSKCWVQWRFAPSFSTWGGRL